VVALQWGHRARAVECGSRGWSLRTRRWLQWGHRARAVECRPRSSRRARGDRGFNGATARARWSARLLPGMTRDVGSFNGATARARWSVASPDHIDGSVFASMGPPRARGGVRQPLRLAVESVRASMGPPRARGGVRTRRPAESWAATCFNGATARARWSAGRDARREHVRVHPASMGPPRARGGVLPLPHGRALVRGASMGPPRARGGVSCPAGHSSPCRRCFNGATARARWSADWLDRAMQKRARLQWGHRARAVECPRCGSSGGSGR